MGKYMGLKVRLYLAKTNTETPTLIAGQKDATLSITVNTVDGNTKDNTDGFAENVVVGREWSISASGAHVLGDPSLVKVEDDILSENFDQDTANYMAYLVYPDDSVKAGKVIITSYNNAAPSGDLVSYDLELQGTGALKALDKLPSFQTPPPVKTADLQTNYKKGEK
jgi:TP901-1 family phage major tail protein